MNELEHNIPAVEIQNVSKLFYKQEQKTFKEFLPALLGGKKTAEWFWALKNVGFTIPKGQTIGIIGTNGSGKSTLLKMMAGVSTPTQGKITAHGRIAPLIELGAGFHPELTGKENVYLNGVLLGMTRKEIDKKFDKIIEFAELGEFIHQPIKHYSSGMYLRLAFSVAIHTEPEILLVDEILAVGDMYFQHKCFEKLRDLKKMGKTIVIVTHDLSAVRVFCDRAVLIHKGHVVLDGTADEVVDTYMRTNLEQFESAQKEEEKKSEPQKAIEIKGLEFRDKEGKKKTAFFSGDKIEFTVSYHAHKEIKDLIVALAFYSAPGQMLYETNTDKLKKTLSVKPGKGSITFVIPALHWLRGKIDISVLFHTTKLEKLDFKNKAYSFEVIRSQSNAEGVVDFKLDLVSHES